MKLGIFGDSFADENLKSGKSWIKCLREEYDYTDVISYGCGGTSLEWSYNNFLEFHTKYDRIIFLTTDYRRHHYFDFKSDKELLFHMDRETSLNQMIEKSKSNKKWKFKISGIDKDILHSIEKLNALYFDSFYWKNTAITESVLYKRPNSVIIDFESMLRLQHIDYEYMGLDLSKVKGEGHNRPCHMSLKQNSEFAEYMNDNIKNGISILETLKEPKKHYTVSKTNKEADIIW